MKHAAEALKNSRLKLKLTDKGDICDAHGLGSLGADDISDFDLTKMMVKLFPIFPGKPIRKGEEWNREQQFPFESKLVHGKMLVYKHYKLANITSLPGGGELLEITTSIRMKLDIHQDSRRRFSLKEGENVDIGLLGTGTLFYDSQKNLISRADADISGRFLVDLKNPIDQGMVSSKIHIRQKFKVELR